jgi:tetrahydromethanopterin S-methyltransferase subunit G
MKADKNDLHELEARIMEKLNEIIKNLLGQFADKADTKKRLTNLEKNVKFNNGGIIFNL